MRAIYVYDIQQCTSYMVCPISINMYIYIYIYIYIYYITIISSLSRNTMKALRTEVFVFRTCIIISGTSHETPSDKKCVTLSELCR